LEKQIEFPLVPRLFIGAVGWRGRRLRKVRQLAGAFPPYGDRFVE
jgi:hypothetical protein